VRVYYLIGGDGAVYNAHAISGEGLSNEPSLRKAAEEAVIQWRYQPATLDGNPSKQVALPVTWFPVLDFTGNRCQLNRSMQHHPLH